jgi:subtilase family serine protease
MKNGRIFLGILGSWMIIAFLGSVLWVNQSFAQTALLAPDLIILKLRAPASAPQGEDISGKVKVYMKNQGNTEAKNFHVDIILKGWAGPTPPPSTEHMLGRAFISSLGPGRSTEVTFPGARIPPDIPLGDCQFCAIADPTNVVRESKEDNNNLCQRITITARTLKIDTPPKIPKEPVK